MEAVCVRGDTRCEVNALAAALHSLHLYCIILTATLIHCCSRFASRKASAQPISWRWQNTRGVASLAVGAIWCLSTAAAVLNLDEVVSLVAACLAPPAWIAATWLHATLWQRRSSSPILYLTLYWLLSSAISAAMICYYLAIGISFASIDVYLHGFTFALCMVLAAVDGLCFFDGVANRIKNNTNDSKESINYTYKHFKAYFYSKITFFWINNLLRKGFKTPLELEDLGELPNEECSERHYLKFKNIYDDIVAKNKKEGKNVSMWQCYVKMTWPNFYISGLLKLLGDLMGLVPPLGLSVIVQYIVTPNVEANSSEVTVRQFLSNGYIMIVVITISAIGQALLSQNSTHLVSVEGIRLKTALQSMIFDKCMRLAPWAASINTSEEKEPLLNVHDESPKQIYTGLLTNLVSQDTYNVMSCVWICHYLWAIPLKVAAILYLLYNKLGVSAIIGCAVSILFVTPLQFYIGKKISDNSKAISKTSDHRISKMTEILQGITVIKLYVWEDLFKEKILNLREVELKLLNKDSVYWGILTFTTQASTILVTIITFTVYYLIEDTKGLSADNVFAGLALFSQLSIPLLVLPVTVLMFVQATISTKRIKDFLALPESLNINETPVEPIKIKPDKFNDAFIDSTPVDSFRITANRLRKKKYIENTTTDYNSSDDERITTNDTKSKIVKFRNVVCSWGGKVSISLEIDDLEICSGKLIMVVGPSGSGKSSLLSAVLGEMNLNNGDIIWNGSCSMSYAGQPPWLLESSVRDNIVMGNTWCQRRYASVLRSTGLKADLHLLPEGDRTLLGSRGSPLSGGQRVRVCVARALYSQAQLLVLDEPLGALDAALAKQLVARGLVTATRSGRTVLLATNRLELLHYADMIIVMENCRVVSWGRAGEDNALRRWNQLAAEARTAAARAGVGPAGGTARERSRLVRVLSRAKLQHPMLSETSIGVSEATGAHLLAELPTCAAGSWRRSMRPSQSTLIRQFSSPPPSVHQLRCRRDIRRVVSADASDAALKREASLLRRLLLQRPHRTLSRWTPRPIRKLLSASNSNNNSIRINDSADDTIRVENGTLCKSTNDNDDITIDDTDEVDDHNDTEQVNSEEAPLAGIVTATETAVICDVFISFQHSWTSTMLTIGQVEVCPWWAYSCACGWWGVAYWCAATGAQGLAVAADWWLAKWTADQTTDGNKMWMGVSVYGSLCAAGVAAAACAQAASARGGGAARRKLHQTLLCATLGAAPDHLDRTPLGALLHRFSADILVIDKKLPTTVCRWVQLALLCSAATLVNAAVTPWSLIAAVPAFALYLTLQNIYRRNARELQRLEAASAAPAVSLVTEVRSGAATVRAGRLQIRMRSEYLKRLDHNHNALLLLNTTNRWLGLSLDLIGAVSVCACLLAALTSGKGAELAGLAGAYSLLLPTYLAHLAKCRADLDLHLSSVERVQIYSDAPQEDYRDHCTVPDSWPSSGDIQLDKISVQHGPRTPPVLNDITIDIKPGEKIAICGRSGCGKSSLLLSCVGAVSVCSGHLRISNEHVTNIPLRTLRHKLIVLPQEVALFSGTLRENLDPLAVHTDDEIWQSLRVVGLKEFVSAHSAGLESSVGGETCCWRGGRASRLCAARVALRAPLAVAMLLDEPGAALDASAERTLMASISACAPNTTVLTVAHRVSSVRNYDRVIIIDRGRIVEQGTPEDLLAEPTSRFARIYAASTRNPHNMRTS